MPTNMGRWRTVPLKNGVVFLLLRKIEENYMAFPNGKLYCLLVRKLSHIYIQSDFSHSMLLTE